MTKFRKVIAKNKRAKFDYEFEQTFMAGIQLEGHEVKSVRGGNVDLKGSYVTVQNNEAWALNIYIKPYSHAYNLGDYDPTQSRKLLLNKKEIEQLQQAKKTNRTVVVSAIGLVGKYIKLEIAIARGKKLHDKRQAIKERDISRDMRKN